MLVVIFGRIGSGKPVREVPETCEQVKQNNNKKYSSHSKVILMGAKLAQCRHSGHDPGHRRC